MTKKRWWKETRLGREVAERLQEEGYTVFTEVPLACCHAVRGGKVARPVDIVAIGEGHTMIVEVKESLGPTVMNQALSCYGYTDYVYVAVPQKGWIDFNMNTRNDIKHGVSKGVGIIGVSRTVFGRHDFVCFKAPVRLPVLPRFKERLESILSLLKPSCRIGHQKFHEDTEARRILGLLCRGPRRTNFNPTPRKLVSV